MEYLIFCCSLFQYIYLKNVNDYVGQINRFINDKCLFTHNVKQHQSTRIPKVNKESCSLMREQNVNDSVTLRKQNVLSKEINSLSIIKLFLHILFFYSSIITINLNTLYLQSLICQEIFSAFPLSQHFFVCYSFISHKVFSVGGYSQYSLLLHVFFFLISHETHQA